MNSYAKRTCNNETPVSQHLRHWLSSATYVFLSETHLQQTSFEGVSIVVVVVVVVVEFCVFVSNWVLTVAG